MKMESRNHGDRGESNLNSKLADCLEPIQSCVSNANNANTCATNKDQGRGNIDAESVKRTVAQLKTSVGEISRVVCAQASTGEGRILKEIRDIKMQLCDLNKNLRGQVNSTADGSAPTTENITQNDQTESAAPNEEVVDAPEPTDTNLVGNPTLINMQETVRTLQCKRDEISSDEINEMLTSVLNDIYKLLGSQGNDEVGKEPIDEENKAVDCATDQEPLKPTSQLNKASACLQKQIKCIKSDATFQDCDLESSIRCTLAMLKDIISTDRPDSNKLGKINKTLKSLACELNRQGGKGSQIAAEINELQKFMLNNGESNANPNNPNNSDQCCADLSETLQMAQIIKQLQGIVQCSQPDTAFPDCGFEANLSFLMDKLMEIIQSYGCNSKPLEEITKLMTCLESEVCKQRPCESEVVAKIHEVQQMLNPSDQCYSNQFDACQTNANQCGASLQATPELCNIIKQMQNLIKCLKPDAQFSGCDLQSTIMCMLGILKAIIQCADSSALERITNMLKCLERELCKQSEAASALLSKVREIQQMLNRGNGCGGSNQQHGAFQCGNDQRGSSLKPTRLLTCLVKHIQNVIQCVKPDLQIPNCDLESTLLFLLNQLKEIIQSGSANPKALEKVPKMMHCLESELYNQGQGKSAIVAKVREIRQLLNGGSSCGPSNRQSDVNQCGTTLQATPELCNIIKQLQSLIKCLKPDAQLGGSDLQSTIMCILEALKMIIQCADSSALEGVGTILKCLETELCEQREASSELLSKMREIQQMLNRGNGCGGSNQQHGAFQCGNDQRGSSLKPTRLLTCLVKHIQNVIQCVKPDLQIPNCDLESTLLFLLNQLKEIIQSGSANPKAVEKVPKMMQCLESELYNQGQGNPTLAAKVQEIKQLLNGGSSCGTSGGQADVNQCGTSLKATPELCRITNQLQSLIKCLKPDAQLSGCDLQSALMCMLETLKTIIQCADPGAVERIGTMLKCLGSELCKQYEAASALLAKVREVQQLLNQGSACGSSNQQRGAGPCDSSSLRETPNLRCLVPELQKIVQFLKPDIRFKSCDLESTILCCLKILQDILQCQGLQPSVMGKLKKILDSLECEVCEQGLFQSNLLTSICEVKQLVCNQKSGSEQVCGGESLEDVVGRTVKTMDECIRELEYVLRDFVGNDTCGQNDRDFCFNGNNNFQKRDDLLFPQN
ncbi:hypothetical protein ECG_07934 [Echinococcus granulosus]|uniref:Uncharacterized protein n=2 Tax=Echinococcus granulosus TaxID=6210 RepID=W6U6W7_ECHGR|nr:hypothetical protein EGR_08172 [Echinococcus granulosus]EUB56935.1 hypothetical protein EGR_08172 [Echinococcus granulosus]KAH9279905.1 hypothetical protein ECG_07934 [Echinococcus granulosus]